MTTIGGLEDCQSEEQQEAVAPEERGRIMATPDQLVMRDVCVVPNHDANPSPTIEAKKPKSSSASTPPQTI